MNINPLSSSDSSSSSPTSESPMEATSIFQDKLLEKFKAWSADPQASDFDSRTVVPVQTQNTQVLSRIRSQMETGELKILCGLEQDSVLIPSHPDSIHFEEQLKKEISKIGGVAQRGRKPLPPGCSVLFNLMFDDLQQAYDNLIAEPSVRKYLSQKIQCKTRDGRFFIDDRLSNLRDLFIRIQACFGLTVAIGKRGGAWHFPIGSQSELTPRMIQDGLRSQMNNMRLELQALDIQQFPNGKVFLQAFGMLEQIVVCKPNLLFKPLTSNPDLSMHCDRLLFRVNKMKTFVENFNNQRFPLKKTHEDRTYHTDLNKALAMMQLFVKEAEEVLKFRNDNHPDFVRIHGFVGKWIGKTEDPDGDFGIYYRLILDSSNIPADPLKRSTKEEITYNVMHRLNLLDWMYTTMLDEMAYYCLTELMRQEKVSQYEVKSTILSMKDVVKSIKDASNDEIEGYFNRLDCELELDEVILQNALQKVWNNNYLFLKHTHYPSMYRTLELRMERLEKTENPILESSLALKEVQIMFGGFFKRNLVRMKEGFERSREVVKLLPAEDLARKTFEAMCELLLLNQEACQAVTGRLDSLILGGLEEIHSAAASVKGKGAPKTVQDDDIAKILQGLGQGSKAKRGKKAVAKAKGKGVAAKPKQTGSNKPVAKEVVVEAIPTIEVPQPIVPVLDSAPTIAHVPKIEVSLTALGNNLQRVSQELPIEGIDSTFRTHWRQAQVENALTLIQQFHESALYPKKSNAIISFDQIDLSRKLVEAILEIVLTSYPVGTDTQSCLREVDDAGHRLHYWTRMLLDAEDVVPGELRMTAWQLREVPYLLSDANACANYPYKTAAFPERLHPRSRQLLDFLLESEKKNGHSPSINRIRNQMTARSVYFAERLIAVMLSPDEAQKGEVGANVIRKLMREELPEVQSKAQSRLHADETDSAEGMPIVEAVKIQHRREAVTAVNNALIWISVRLVAPVQGSQNRSLRTQKRDQALRNAASYLKRLKEHLDHFRFNRPILTLLSQIELSRRAHKELHIAALYQVANGSQIADEERYTNNPLFISEKLRGVLGKQVQLPQLGRWLSVAHHVASYPVPLVKKSHQGFEEKTLRSLVGQVRELIDGFTVVGSKTAADDETTSLKLLLKTNEKERTFPAIEAMIELLHNGFKNG